jgi:hypothetical protein
MSKRQIAFRAEEQLIQDFDTTAHAWGTNRTALLNMLMQEANRLYRAGAFLFRLSAQDTAQTEQNEESDRS